MHRLFLIPVTEYGFQAMTPDASGSPRGNALSNGTRKEHVGSTQWMHRVGASVNQHVPVLV